MELMTNHVIFLLVCQDSGVSSGFTDNLKWIGFKHRKYVGVCDSLSFCKCAIANQMYKLRNLMKMAVHQFGSLDYI
jgi:hypothetical protein